MCQTVVFVYSCRHRQTGKTVPCPAAREAATENGCLALLAHVFSRGGGGGGGGGGDGSGCHDVQTSLRFLREACLACHYENRYRGTPIQNFFPEYAMTGVAAPEPPAWPGQFSHDPSGVVQRPYVGDVMRTSAMAAATAAIAVAMPAPSVLEHDHERAAANKKGDRKQQQSARRRRRQPMPTSVRSGGPGGAGPSSSSARASSSASASSSSNNGPPSRGRSPSAAPRSPTDVRLRSHNLDHNLNHGRSRSQSRSQSLSRSNSRGRSLNRNPSRSHSRGRGRGRARSMSTGRGRPSSSVRNLPRRGLSRSRSQLAARRFAMAYRLSTVEEDPIPLGAMPAATATPTQDNKTDVKGKGKERAATPTQDKGKGKDNTI